eukprot:8196127-Lingulodinium_polyedra.AAC.1
MDGLNSLACAAVPVSPVLALLICSLSGCISMHELSRGSRNLDLLFPFAFAEVVFQQFGWP